MQLRSGNVLLRPFDPTLTEALFNIRNHPSVRRHLRDPSPLDWVQHRQWVEDNLLAAQRLALFLVFAGESAVGIALLRDFKTLGAERSAEVGVMIVNSRRRPLVAYKSGHMTVFYGFEVLALSKIYSLVPLSNPAALSFNLRCGFEPTGVSSDRVTELALTRRVYDAPRNQRFRIRHAITVLAKP